MFFRLASCVKDRVEKHVVTHRGAYPSRRRRAYRGVGIEKEVEKAGKEKKRQIDRHTDRDKDRDTNRHRQSRHRQNRHQQPPTATDSHRWRSTETD